MKNKNKKSGFLLLEILVAVSIFLLVVSISLGSIINLLDSGRRVRGNKDAMDNLNNSIEYMTRTIRFGSDYHCGSSPSAVLTIPQNCITGSNLLASLFKGQTIVYRLSAGRIQISENGGSTYRSLTAQNVVIDKLEFRVFGTDKTDTIQPYVFIIIAGRVVSDSSNSSRFDIQTVMSQRKLDLNI